MRKSVWIFHGNPDTCYHIILWVNVQGVISKCTATLQVKDPFIEMQFIFHIATHHFSCASHLRIVLRKEKVVSSPVRGHTSPTLRSVSEWYWRREVVNFPECPFTSVRNRLIPIIFWSHKSFHRIFFIKLARPITSICQQWGSDEGALPWTYRAMNVCFNHNVSKRLNVKMPQYLSELRYTLSPWHRWGVAYTTSNMCFVRCS